jgi:hypothetical protein
MRSAFVPPYAVLFRQRAMEQLYALPVSLREQVRAYSAALASLASLSPRSDRGGQRPCLLQQEFDGQRVLFEVRPEGGTLWVEHLAVAGMAARASAG